jgi:hypothetical protein
MRRNNPDLCIFSHAKSSLDKLIVIGVSAASTSDEMDPPQLTQPAPYSLTGLSQSAMRQTSGST